MSDLNPTGERRPVVRSDVSAGASAEFARECAPDLVSVGVERAIAVDQTNHNVVVDERVIVKWYGPPVPVPHRSTTLAGHLLDVGFTETPKFLGSRVEDDVLVATATQFVSGARDGWDWFVDRFTDAADGSSTEQDVIGGAEAIGALSARLQAALATPSTMIPEPVTVHVAGAADDERRRCRALIDRATDVVNSSNDAAAQRAVAGHHSQITQIVDAMPTGPAAIATIHGDLHVGQILEAGNRLMIVDFDGNPLLDAPERNRRRPMAVDVASLVQSIDHAGRVAARRRPDTARDDLIAAATNAALNAYREGLAAVGLSRLLDESMLAGLRVAQELHELVYAAEYLPHWSYAPIGALHALLGEQGDC